MDKENTLAVTCGDWDLRSMLPFELAYHNLNLSLADETKVFTKWCNIKHLFTLFTNKKVDSMVRMLNVINEPLVGTHHSGIDDTRNIATIARWLARQGCIFRPTSSGNLELDDEDLIRVEKLKEEKEQRKKELSEVMRGKIEEGKVSPWDMFKFGVAGEEFGEWDEMGVPVRWKNGEGLSKSAVNRRRKMWRVQGVKYERWLAWKEGRSEDET